MTRVAHVGPPLARQGGPAGYLLQLAQAAVAAGAGDEVRFPPAAVPRPAPPRPSRSGVRRALSRLKRRIVTPKFERPSDASLRAPGGHIDGAAASAREEIVRDASVSIAQARAIGADVIFCHDSAAAEHVLRNRTAHQSVWLMLHSPMPLAFYLAWNWGVPERDWREVLQYPDVQRWNAWEVDIWRRVDRLIVPCREAFDEIVRLVPEAAPLRKSLACVLSGAALPAPTDASADRSTLRERWQLPADLPIGVFIGNNQPYRGLDALVAAVQAMTGSDPAGLIAVAGPGRSSIATHSRIRALGPVADVRGLLAAADFVVNVNRFSLFDLSTIEALEIGRPMLMHATGGNRTFERLGAGAVTIADLNPPTIAAGLAGMFAMTASHREALGEASRRCYDVHLTLDAFWRRHAELYASAGVGAITR